MLLIGLTGSIATGKSSVSSVLSSPPHSLPIIDADVLARKVVEPGTSGYEAIVRYFGTTTPDLLLPASDTAASDSNSVPGSGSGSLGKKAAGRPLNRPALGKRVFGDSAERRRDRGVLNRIVHPAVRREMYRQLLWCYLRGCWAVVLDVPLLFETALDRMCGVVLVVAVRDPEVQMRRLMDRDSHLSREDAQNRVLSQGDVRLKARRCEERGEGKGVVVWNDGSRVELQREVERALEKIHRGCPAWWGRLLLLFPPLAVVSGAWTLWQNVRINKRWRELEGRERAKL